MRLSIVEWIPGGPYKSPEERATLCEFRIELGSETVSSHLDTDTRETHDTLRLPLVHFAEGIGSDWWKIFGGRHAGHRAIA